MGKKKISEFPTVTPIGTDKFLVERADGSYKSILSSNIVGAITVDLTIIDGSTNAVSGNAVFDGLATKQNYLVSGTNIRTVNGSELLGSTDLQVGTIKGTIAATSGLIPIGNGTSDTVSASTDFTNNGTDFFAKLSTSIKHQIGSTATNAMYRLDSVGFRIGTIATIGTANTAIFQINGAAIITATNTTYGTSSGDSLTSALNNTAIGTLALSTNISSSNNTAVGYAALQLSTSSGNTSIGVNSLSTLVSGINNTHVGLGAGLYIKGSTNTGVGFSSQLAHVTLTKAGAIENSSLGAESLFSITTGIGNSNVGAASLKNTTSGGGNVGIGKNAGFSNTTGSNNIFIGLQTMQNNLGSSNIAIGYQAGIYETAASDSFYLHNGVGQTTVADGKTRSLLYGNFSAALANQLLTVNGGFRVQTSEMSTDSALRVSTLGIRATTIASIGTAASALVDIDASTTSRSSLRIRSGVSPTNPNDGDIWFDGTDIKMRISGITKTFTLT